MLVQFWQITKVLAIPPVLVSLKKATDEFSIDALIEKADKALHQAKSKGKNQLAGY